MTEPRSSSFSARPYGRQIAEHLFDMYNALQDAPLGLSASKVFLDHYEKAVELCSELLRRAEDAEVGNVPM